jgi:hypothetical protein
MRRASCGLADVLFFARERAAVQEGLHRRLAEAPTALMGGPRRGSGCTSIQPIASA